MVARQPNYPWPAVGNARRVSAQRLWDRFLRMIASSFGGHSMLDVLMLFPAYADVSEVDEHLRNLVPAISATAGLRSMPNE